MMPEIGHVNELPEATEIGAPTHVPYIHRTGMASQISIPLIVQPPEEFVHDSEVEFTDWATPLTVVAAENEHAVPPVTYPFPLGSSVMSVPPLGELEPSFTTMPVVDAVAC
jgi:hypothetical protein